MVWTVTGVAYDNNVTFADGTKVALCRRERPHLLWKHGRAGGIPVALTNGVQLTGPRNTAFVDSVFTLAQGIEE